MRIIAVLSWFDESPTMLAACVASLGKIEADHLVAVDGAYALMPGGRGASSVDETRVITDVCAASGMGLTLHQPARTFRGNEVEKRNATLALALASATPEDWLFVVDADEVVESVRGDARGLLEASESDVGTYGLVTRIDPLRGAEDDFVARCAGGLEGVTPVPGLLRALPGLRYESNHYTVVDGDRILCPVSPLSEEPIDLTSVIRVEHRKHLRDSYRADRAECFRATRESTRIEHVHEAGVTA